jgi:hypothetical protein
LHLVAASRIRASDPPSSSSSWFYTHFAASSKTAWELIGVEDSVRSPEVVATPTASRLAPAAKKRDDAAQAVERSQGLRLGQRFGDADEAK